MPPTTKKKVAVEPLPKSIRDELRMTAAMRCYSMLQQGKTKRVKELQSDISDLFHGNPAASIPSQIELLCNGSFTYKSIYSEEVVVTTKKNASKSDINLKVLKPLLSKDVTRKYVFGKDILTWDLEKQNRTGSQLLSVRNILDMAKRGTLNYQKASAFASHKFDLDKICCKESYFYICSS